MADNIEITAGSGTSVSTDDAGAGGHVQRVKLTYSADGSAVHVPADADGLLVNLGTNNDVTVTGTVTVGSHAVTNAGTFAVQDSEKLADDGAFTPGSTKVLPVGFLADDSSTDLVDEGDAGAARMTLDRRLIVQVGESGAKDVKGGGNKTDTTDQSIMAAGGAGVYNYLQWVAVYNASATNTYANVKDGSTIVAVLPLPAYGGALFQPPRAIRGTANTAWNVAAGASVTTASFYGGGYSATA